MGEPDLGDAWYGPFSGANVHSPEREVMQAIGPAMDAMERNVMRVELPQRVAECIARTNAMEGSNA